MTKMSVQQWREMIVATADEFGWGEREAGEAFDDLIESVRLEGWEARSDAEGLR